MQNKTLIFGSIVTLGLLIGGVFLLSEQKQETPLKANAKTDVAVEKTTHDWGEIDLNGGDVEKTFEITNSGTEDLILTNVVTSCMCTTAQLILEDETSPYFGMHTKSSYKLLVPPGKTAQLKVVFDPAYHGPSGVGPITRQVSVETNDPDKPELNFMLTAIVRK